jgi:anti-sigma28 factor (negative regulator of flagellin synthesis)
MINPIGNKGSDEVVRPGGTTRNPPRHKKSGLRSRVQKDQAALEPEKGDKVEISSFARDMQAIRAPGGSGRRTRRPSGGPSQSKIEQGTYHMDTRAVAQKMF